MPARAPALPGWRGTYLSRNDQSNVLEVSDFYALARELTYPRRENSPGSADALAGPSLDTHLPRRQGIRVRSSSINHLVQSPAHQRTTMPARAPALPGWRATHLSRHDQSHALRVSDFYAFATELTYSRRKASPVGAPSRISQPGLVRQGEVDPRI